MRSTVAALAVDAGAVGSFLGGEDFLEVAVTEPADRLGHAPYFDEIGTHEDATVTGSPSTVRHWGVTVPRSFFTGNAAISTVRSRAFL
jgi:hypothetical protein